MGWALGFLALHRVFLAEEANYRPSVFAGLFFARALSGCDARAPPMVSRDAANIEGN